MRLCIYENLYIAFFIERCGRNVSSRQKNLNDEHCFFNKNILDILENKKRSDSNMFERIG